MKNGLLILVGCMLFSLGFDLFLGPNQINVGGVSGIGQLITHLTGFGSVALWSLLINVPLYSVSRIGDALDRREHAGSPPDDAGPA